MVWPRRRCGGLPHDGLGARGKPIAPDPDGWSRLRAGWMLNATLVLGALMFMVLIVLATIGTHSDRQDQIVPLICLIVGFGAGTVYMAWVSYGRVIKFNDTQIEVQHRFGSTIRWSWSEVRGVRTSSISGEHILTFDDGRKLRVSTWMKGANDLALKLRERGFH
jgi:hypothetical protein